MGGRKTTVNKTEEPKGGTAAKKRAAKIVAEKPARGKVETGKVTPEEAVEEGRAAVVRKLLRKLEEQMGGGEVKASLGDYIRLVQLHKELDEEAPKEIKVTWVEPAEDKKGKPESGGEE